MTELVPTTLAQLRGLRGFTVAELARIVGVSEKMIRRYEDGKSQPGLDVATRYAAALSVTLDQLGALASGRSMGVVTGGEEAARKEDIPPKTSPAELAGVAFGDPGKLWPMPWRGKRPD